jgi:pheromone shutdown protein TraB
MIKIVGTNHLDSKEEIEKIIKQFNPDILGVELCDFRARVIADEVIIVTTGERKAMSDMGYESKSLLDKITSKIKEKSEKENLDYGSDMKTVLRYAHENKIPLLLVDMPILKIQELFSKIPLEEQKVFTQGLLEFENQSMNKQIDEEEVLINLKKLCPTAFEFLINMRNLYITNQILKAKINNPKKNILVFLGKGHVKQVELMLK